MLHIDRGAGKGKGAAVFLHHIHQRKVQIVSHGVKVGQLRGVDLGADPNVDAAVAKGRWKNVYASTNIAEYWAEGVQDWFNVNAEVNKDDGDGKHNKINTREELQRYDPGLYSILKRFFPEVKEQISRHKKENLYDWKE